MWVGTRTRFVDGIGLGRSVNFWIGWIGMDLAKWTHDQLGTAVIVDYVY